MRANRYDQIPQLMTGQLITPATAVFPGLTTVVAKRGVGGVGGGGSLQLTSSSVNTNIRGISGTTETPNTTLLGFTLKPKSGSNNLAGPPRHSIQFFH
jgi:hypothetical protein